VIICRPFGRRWLRDTVRSYPKQKRTVAEQSAADSRNHLLSSLSPADFGLVEPHLEAIALGLHFVLEESNEPIEHVYFPETGLASVVATSSRKREIEVGIIGREGMSGINVVMGDDRSPHSTYIQCAGHGAARRASSASTP